MTGSKSLHVRPGRLAISRTLESRAPLERGRRQKTIVCPTLRPRLSSLLLCAPAHIANRLATRPTSLGIYGRSFAMPIRLALERASQRDQLIFVKRAADQRN